MGRVTPPVVTGEQSPPPDGGPALVTARSGSVPTWFEATVEALGYDLVATLSVDEPEHGRYNLSPGLVDRLTDRIRETGAVFLGIDERLHPGQVVDLETALPPVATRDRRGVVWRRLGGVAADCLSLRDCRIERRRAARAERDSAGQSPAGGGGRVAHLDRREQELRRSLDRRRQEARERVGAAYDGVDARVALVGPPTAPTTALWAALTGETGDGNGPFRPAGPTTAVTTAGPHEIALTDTPGLVEGLPDWYTGAVPATLAAVEHARAVLVVGSSGTVGPLCRAVDDRFEADTIPAVPPAGPATVAGRETVDVTDTAAVRGRLAAVLPSSRVELSLPYGDDTQALVSWLHDQTTVQDSSYDQRVTLTVALSTDRVADLERRVAAVDGECERVD